MKEIDKLLSELQRTVKVPKNQRNSFGNYNYRSCEDILEAVKPHLPEGVTLTLNDEVVMIGARYYIKATAELRDEDEVRTSTAFAREEESKKGMDGSQITGSASSYARKYALNGLLLIDDTKDADTQDNTEKKEVAKPVKPVTKKDPRTDTIKELLQDLGHFPKTVKEASDVVFELTTMEFKPEHYDEIIIELTERREARDALTN